MTYYKAKSVTGTFGYEGYVPGSFRNNAKLIYEVPSGCIARLVSGMYIVAKGGVSESERTDIQCFIKINNQTIGSLNRSGGWVIGFSGEGSSSEPQVSDYYEGGLGTSNHLRTFTSCPVYLNAGDKLYAITVAEYPAKNFTYMNDEGTYCLNFIEEYQE